MTYAPIQGNCPVCHQDSANTALQAGAAQEEIEALRQQLTVVNSKFDAINNDFSALEDQLADHIKREMMLRDALLHLWNERTPDSLDKAGEALAATADLKDVRLCHAEPKP